MTLVDYWPSADRINACVPSEAEILSDSVFLAVHQPTALFRRVMGTKPMTEPAREADLLAWLLSPNVPEGHRVVPIVGRAGTGKSHLIRWLDIHIPREGRHVIRIPKSSSLRRVLELVLQGLDGPGYAAIRDELLRARDNLSLIAAEEGLLANFRTALRERGQAADAQARQAVQAGQEPNRALQDTIAHAEGLYALLDGKTRDALLAEGGVFRSLIEGVLSGHLRPSDAATQFNPDHFRFSDVRLDQVAPGRHQMYLRRLKLSQNDRDRTAAVELMNEVRDAAIYPLLGLGPGRLTELFEDVRRELLREGRELVVLIEDFVTMTGIQKPLLDVMIREGVRDGRRVLCTMRTALAVTDGTLTPWDTVRTRTKDTDWVIPEVPPGEERTLEAIVNLVGAYLNAARVGADALSQAHDAAADPTTQEWVPEFDRTNALAEDGRRQLGAFGACRRGYPLFPFNRTAIEQLARRYLRTADEQIRLNPRHVINHILRDPLLAHQSAYIDGRFPPGNFCGFSPNELGPDVKTLLSGRAGEAFDRTAALLGYWGGLPQTPADIRLAPEVYRAFNLDPLASDAAQPPPAPAPTAQVPRAPEPAAPVAPPPTVPLRSTPSSPWPADVVTRTAMLRRWIGERIITQTDANWIRGEVLQAVDAAIDWDVELLKPPRLTQGAYYTGWVYLPQAKGGQPTCTSANALVTVCDDETFADPLRANEVELDLRAVIRFHALGHFDYEGGAADQARYANFVERGTLQAVAFIRERYERLTGDQVPPVAQALVVSARVLNLTGAHAGDDAGILDALLGASPNPQALPQDDSKWSKLRRACAAERDRAVKFLLKRVGARQGGADAVYAVDAARLLAAIAPTRKSWSVETAFQEGQLEEDARLVRSFVQSVRPEVVAAAVAERRERLVQWGANLREWLGEQFDKVAVVETLRETVTKAVAADVFKESGDMTADRLRGLIDEFRKAAVAEARDEIERLTPEASPGLVLSVLARVDDKVLETVDRLREAYNAFLDRMTTAVVARMKAYQPDFDPTASDGEAQTADAGAAVRAMAAEIDTLLANLGDTVQELAEKAPVKPAKGRRPARAVAEGGAS